MNQAAAPQQGAGPSTADKKAANGDDRTSSGVPSPRPTLTTDLDDEASANLAMASNIAALARCAARVAKWLDVGHHAAASSATPVAVSASIACGPVLMGIVGVDLNCSATSTVVTAAAELAQKCPAGIWLHESAASVLLASSSAASQHSLHTSSRQVDVERPDGCGTETSTMVEVTVAAAVLQGEGGEDSFSMTV